jgi:hypothetical protein
MARSSKIFPKLGFLVWKQTIWQPCFRYLLGRVFARWTCVTSKTYAQTYAMIRILREKIEELHPAQAWENWSFLIHLRNLQTHICTEIFSLRIYYSCTNYLHCTYVHTPTLM